MGEQRDEQVETAAAAVEEAWELLRFAGELASRAERLKNCHVGQEFPHHIIRINAALAVLAPVVAETSAEKIRERAFNSFPDVVDEVKAEVLRGKHHDTPTLYFEVGDPIEIEGVFEGHSDVALEEFEVGIGASGSAFLAVFGALAEGVASSAFVRLLEELRVRGVRTKVDAFGAAEICKIDALRRDPQLQLGPCPAYRVSIGRARFEVKVHDAAGKEVRAYLVDREGRICSGDPQAKPEMHA